jgi:hypothetical protein
VRVFAGGVAVSNRKENPMFVFHPSVQDAMFPKDLPTNDAGSAHARTIELWDAWTFAEVDAEVALKRWWDAPDGDRSAAFAAYSAALDREAQAAKALQMRLSIDLATAPSWS